MAKASPAMRIAIYGKRFDRSAPRRRGTIVLNTTTCDKAGAATATLPRSDLEFASFFSVSGWILHKEPL